MTFSFPHALEQALVDAVPAFTDGTDRLVFVVVADRPDPGAGEGPPLADLFAGGGGTALAGDGGYALVRGVIGELSDLGFPLESIYLAAGGVDSETSGVGTASEIMAGDGDPVDPDPVPDPIEPEDPAPIDPPAPTDEPELGDVPGDVVEPEPEDGAVIPPEPDTVGTPDPAPGDAGLDG